MPLPSDLRHGLHRDSCSLATLICGYRPQERVPILGRQGGGGGGGRMTLPGHTRLALSSFLLSLSLKHWMDSSRGEAVLEELHRRSFLNAYPAASQLCLLARVWEAEEPSGAG